MFLWGVFVCGAVTHIVDRFFVFRKDGVYTVRILSGGIGYGSSVLAFHLKVLVRGKLCMNFVICMVFGVCNCSNAIVFQLVLYIGEKNIHLENLSTGLECRTYVFLCD